MLPYFSGPILATASLFPLPKWTTAAGSPSTGFNVGCFDRAGLLPHDREQPIQIAEIRDVALHATGAMADFADRCVKLRLPSSRHEDAGALLGEPLGRRESMPLFAPVMRATSPNLPIVVSL
jgi:hypothetical protein